MALPWNKIGLVSTIVLASLCLCFAGCKAEDLKNLYQDIYQRVTEPSGGAANTCVCTYMMYGKTQTETYRVPSEEYNCTGLQSYLKNDKKYAGVSCQPAK